MVLFQAPIDSQIVKQTHQANKFQVARNKEKNKITITFDHIDHLEGCVIQCVHCAPDESFISFEGKIKEAEIQKLKNPSQAVRTKLIKSSARWTLAAVGIVFFFCAEHNPNTIFITFPVMIIGMACIFTIAWRLEAPQIPFEESSTQIS